MSKILKREENTPMKEALHDMIHDLQRQDKTYSLDGPQMLNVVKHDNTFRMKEVFGTEFIPSYARYGQSGIIFGFEPEDPQEEYEFVEVRENKMDTVFPLLLDDALTWAGRHLLKYNMPVISSHDFSSHDFSDFLDKFAVMVTEIQKIEAETDDSELATLPNFGMF